MAPPADLPFVTRPDPDAALLRRVAAGDEDAFEVLYDRHTPVLLAVALRIVRTNADAEDVVQQSWVKAWQAARTFDPARGASFKTFAYTRFSTLFFCGMPPPLMTRSMGTPYLPIRSRITRV